MKIKKEVKEIKEERDKRARVAAFFDLDGTLMPLPSLERRFFRTLRQRRAIPAKNYLLWLREALCLLPRGILTVAHANKMYLRGVQSLDESDSGNRTDSRGHKGCHQVEGRASATPPKREQHNPRCPVPNFSEDALERFAWHVSQGHAIVIVSGTLEPLAIAMARKLEAELAARGLTTKIRVCATKLEQIDNKWTGKILGEAMFRKAKARAAKKLAQELGLDLQRSYAYGDSANDQWLLASVGNPSVVNPSAKLVRIAKRQRWLMLRWGEERNAMPSEIPDPVAANSENMETRKWKPKTLTNKFALRERPRNFQEEMRCAER